MVVIIISKTNQIIKNHSYYVHCLIIKIKLFIIINLIYKVYHIKIII